MLIVALTPHHLREGARKPPTLADIKWTTAIAKMADEIIFNDGSDEPTLLKTGAPHANERFCHITIGPESLKVTILRLGLGPYDPSPEDKWKINLIQNELDQVKKRRQAPGYNANAERNQRERILAAVDNLVERLMYEDRKEDDDLPFGSIQRAVAAGEITLPEVTGRFSDKLRPYFNKLSDHVGTREE